MSNNSDSKPLSFLDLPLELRRKIYDEFFIERSMNPALGTNITNMSAVYVNKEFNREISEKLYRNIRFSGPRHMEHWLKRIGYQNRYNIKSIMLQSLDIGLSSWSSILIEMDIHPVIIMCVLKLHFPGEYKNVEDYINVIFLHIQYILSINSLNKVIIQIAEPRVDLVRELFLLERYYSEYYDSPFTPWIDRLIESMSLIINDITLHGYKYNIDKIKKQIIFYRG